MQGMWAFRKRWLLSVLLAGFAFSVQPGLANAAVSECINAAYNAAELAICLKRCRSAANECLESARQVFYNCYHSCDGLEGEAWVQCTDLCRNEHAQNIQHCWNEYDKCKKNCRKCFKDKLVNGIAP